MFQSLVRLIEKMRKTLVLLVLSCSSVAVTVAEEQLVSNPANVRASREYVNPVIHADYSDPDVVASPDGKTFYMTASSFQCTPGLPILRSHDLVNWTLVNYALDSVPPVKFYGDNIPRHGKGVWAPCIKYHNGEYYIYWGDPDFGIFMTKTSNPEGKWSTPVLVRAGKGLIDPSPYWDADGKANLSNGWAASRAGFNSILTLSEMTPDGTALISTPKIIYDGNDGVNHTVEGTKLYRKGDYYYLFAPAGGVVDGWQLVMRSKNIYGPYESKIVMAQGKSDINGPHQGAWVTNAAGEDWFLHFQDKGAFGRVVHLNPMKWVDGWPVIGVDKDGDGCGEPVKKFTRPAVTGGVKDFIAKNDAPESLFQWHSNYNDFYGFPIPNGLMRIYGHTLSEEFVNLWEVPNLWLEKFPLDEFTFTADVVVSAKENAEGVSSGIIVMGWDYCRLGLTKRGDSFVLQLADCYEAEQGGKENVKDIATIAPTRVYSAGLHGNMECALKLRVTVNKKGECRFSYSTDNNCFRDVEGVFKARAGKWIGAKVGFYSVTPAGCHDRGWIDVIGIRN